MGWLNPYVAGLLALVVIVAVIAFLRRWNPLLIAVGKDGRASISLLQWIVWTAVGACAYVMVFVQRENLFAANPLGFAQGVSAAAVNASQFAANPAVAAAKLHAAGITSVSLKPNLLLAMGLSSLTAIVAKAVTTTQVGSGKVVKKARAGRARFGDLFLDDEGRFDLSKVQLFLWTLVAVGVFAVRLLLQMRGPIPDLPDIDDSLVVLMGLGQGAYIGRKLTLSTSPQLTGIQPVHGPPGTKILLKGISLGGDEAGEIAAGGVILVNGESSPFVASEWTGDAIKFKLPPTWKGRPWTDKQVVNFAVAISGRTTDSVPFIVDVPELTGIAPQSGPPDAEITLTGTSLGDEEHGAAPERSAILIDGEVSEVRATEWSASEVKLKLPKTWHEKEWANGQIVKLAVKVHGKVTKPMEYKVVR